MLHVRSAASLDVLAGDLGEVLRVPLEDPMASEWIAVPSQGMARWLRLRLARVLGAGPDRQDGVAANLGVSFPGALRAAVLQAGLDGAADDPWSIERLVWSVLATIADHDRDPRLGPLVSLPEDSTRYGRARRLADLFDRYAVHRPAMVRAWADGQDVDGAGAALPDHAAWQPHLWRAVRRRVGRPSPAEAWPDLVERLRHGDLVLDLPARLSFFGLATIPGGAPFLDLAAAVGQQRDVHLFLFLPSPGLLASVRHDSVRHPPVRPVAVGAAGALRADDRTGDAVGHPLVRSWARPSREALALLTAPAGEGVNDPGTGSPGPAEPEGAQEAAPARTASLLARVQDDLRAAREPSGDFVVAEDDRSIEVHACHGPTRQVEVLRDSILHRLAEDESLREDEILVVVPDLDTFAPLVEAAFSAPAGPDGAEPSADIPRIRYAITDRSLRDTYALLGALGALVDLVDGRFPASAVLDFLALPPVRTRFDLGDDDLSTIAGWVADVDVTWGLDGEHRKRWGIPGGFAAGSWRAALDRILLGVAVSDDPEDLAPGDVLPFGVEGSGIAVAGRLADALQRLDELAALAALPREASAWCRVLGDAADALFAPSRDAPWQDAALRRLLGAIEEESAGVDVPLTIADFRRVLAAHLEGTPRRPDFFRGGVTVTSLTPLRGVPFRVVCILGLDERAVAGTAAEGDDLLAAAPHLGDPDARAETRQALLETVLAAGDALVVTRTGCNLVTNQPVPRAVPLAELFDAVLATVAPAAPGDPRHRESVASWLEVVHPRQPFDERNFRPGVLRPGGPWSFDGRAREGALARARAGDAAFTFLRHPLPAEEPDVVELADLRRTLEHPVQDFLRTRLQLRLPRDAEPVAEDLVVALAPLPRWNVAERLLAALLAGSTVDTWLRREHARGALPGGMLGASESEAIVAIVTELVHAATAFGYTPGTAVLEPVDVVLDDGTRVVGTVRDDHAARPGPVRVSYSRTQPKRLLGPWLDLVALTAQDPARDWRAVVVNRAPTKDKVHVTVRDPNGAEPAERAARARAGLTTAVDLFRRARREPIPLFPTLARALYDGTAHRRLWKDDAGPGGWRRGDGNDVANELVYGHLDYESLLGLPALVSDPPGDRTGRVERYAHHLWGAVDASTIEPRDEVAESGGTA